MADSGEDGVKRVTRTGLALVHEGELVLPAAGSEAEAAQVKSDDRASIQYYFPVEIEVIAGGEDLDVQQIADLALARLARSMRARRS